MSCTATKAYIQRMWNTLSNCNLSSVLHTSPQISFWCSQLWSHCLSPPLLPFFTKSFSLYKYVWKHSMKDIIALWGNMSVELTTFTQCIDRLLATIAVDILQQSLFFLIQCWGYQGRYVAYSGTETVTTSLFLTACASHWAIEFITLKAVTNDPTLHTRQSWYFKQISS